ncbi:MAG: hypothetical protein JW881_05445 [Spirochaetales bacterium]|nr:hypothetical protein [Spirochaetales bacterium]
MNTRQVSRVMIHIVCLITFIAPGLPLRLSAAPQKEIPLVPGEREELSLNGKWQVATTSEGAAVAKSAAWKTMSVPCLISGNAVGGSRYVWYRRDIRIPDKWDGLAVFLLLVGARFDPHVYIDGRLIASRLDGWTPFEIDVTDHIRPGGSVTLDIRCRDWSATFAPGFAIPPGTEAGWDTLRGYPAGNILAPIGGHFTSYGIWDDVILSARPRAHLSDIAVSTSYRKKTLSVRGTSSSYARVLRVRGEVFEENPDGEDRGECVLALRSSVVDEKGGWSLSVSIFGGEIRFWSPEDPFLYRLRLFLEDASTGRIIDACDERIGFRELWAEGPEFYLNGVKRHLLASSGWPASSYQTDAEVREALETIKAGNNVAFRFHTQPWQRKWLSLADEIGLMIIEEGALWCDGGGGYAYNDDRFWENVWNHLSGMVLRDRNHPCLVMWSIENELLHCGASRYSDNAEKNLAALGVRLKKLDPDHLVTYEADLDPGGVADVIGLHYPHEMPEYSDYPDTADWLSERVVTGTEGGLMGSRGEEFFWDREKPLYIGEYLWIPREDYAPGTVFFGDEAYGNLKDYRIRAKALAWEFQTIAYRRAGVSGMCPWTIADSGGRIDTGGVLFRTQKRVYEPVAAFARELDSRFFAGEIVSRHFDVFNDSPRALSLKLKWNLRGIASGESDDFKLGPGGRTVATVNVPMPDAECVGGRKFTASLETDGKIVHSTETAFSIFEKKPLTVPKGIALAIYDPGKRWALGGEKIDASRISNLKEISRFQPEKTILLIGPYALHKREAVDGLPVIGGGVEGSADVRRFLENGGRLFVMEQETFGGLAAGISLVDHPATMTFPLDRRHPLFDGLAAGAFRFWRNGHYVAKKQIVRPEGHGGKALLVSGGDNSLDQSPLVELPFGRGRIILCQALAGTSCADEPSARMIVGNAISFLAPVYRHASVSAVLAEGREAGSFVDRLDLMGLDYREITGVPAARDIRGTGPVLLHGGGEALDRSIPLLAEYLTDEKRKPVLYWHCPEKDSFERLMKALSMPDLTLSAGSGPLTFLDGDHEISGGICREDLVFIGEYREPVWQRGFDPDPAIADTVLDIAPGKDNGVRYEVETWEREGKYVEVADGGSTVRFATNGSVSGTIDVLSEGLHRITVMAGGTRAEGIWPLLVISGKEIPETYIALTGSEVKAYHTFMSLPAGRCSLRLSFVNDYYKNGEDRNLSVDAVIISKVDADENGIHLISLPPAIAVIDTPPAGRIVCDCVRWHTAGHNRVRGMRYASVLLANCGAAFVPPPVEPEWIPVAFFKPAGKIAHFRQTDNEIALYSAGTVTADFYCREEDDYEIFVRGYSTPLDGIFALIRISIDDKEKTGTEVVSAFTTTFEAGSVHLKAGVHRISVTYVNDKWKPEGDRNLFLEGIGFSGKK